MAETNAGCVEGFRPQLEAQRLTFFPNLGIKPSLPLVLSPALVWTPTWRLRLLPNRHFVSVTTIRASDIGELSMRAPFPRNPPKYKSNKQSNMAARSGQTGDVEDRRGGEDDRVTAAPSLASRSRIPSKRAFINLRHWEKSPTMPQFVGPNVRVWNSGTNWFR